MERPGYFIHKVRSAVESSKKHPLEDLVHVDEFTIDRQEENASGRSYNTCKTKVIMAMELNEKRKVKRAYAKVIDDYSAMSFTPLFEQHISEEARIVTYKWRGYNTLKKSNNI